MQFLVNDQQMSSDTPLTFQQLMEKINTPEKGVAVAVNHQIISRSQWAEKNITDGDCITLIKATAGG